MMYGNLNDGGGIPKKAIKKKWEYVVHTVARLGKGILAGSASRYKRTEFDWLYIQRLI